METLQYVFHLGRCEVDDVIMNAIGVAFGLLAYILVSYIEKRNRKFQHRKRI
ncbi:MAG: VanZ family protein [Eubacterium sp.]